MYPKEDAGIVHWSIADLCCCMVDIGILEARPVNCGPFISVSIWTKLVVTSPPRFSVLLNLIKTVKNGIISSNATNENTYIDVYRFSVTHNANIARRACKRVSMLMKKEIRVFR